VTIGSLDFKHGEKLSNQQEKRFLGEMWPGANSIGEVRCCGTKQSAESLPPSEPKDEIGRILSLCIELSV
jgi:hypothetical protein